MQKKRKIDKLLSFYNVALCSLHKFRRNTSYPYGIEKRKKKKRISRKKNMIVLSGTDNNVTLND